MLHDAVANWAAAEKAHLTQITAKTAGDYITGIQQAVHGKPDLIISVGGRAVRAGVAAVLSGLTGIVVWLS